MHSEQDVARFWKKVERGSPDDCWLFQGGTFGSKGYGAFAYAGKKPGYAHRFSYEAHHGPIPEGAVIMHLCDEPKCVNPAHLKAGSQRQNIRDSMKKGRWMSRARKEYLFERPRCEGCGSFYAPSEEWVRYCPTCENSVILP
jgi:hypothetical protein